MDPLIGRGSAVPSIPLATTPNYSYGSNQAALNLTHVNTNQTGAQNVSHVNTNQTGAQNVTHINTKQTG
jgi:hypothetical protein